MKKEKDKTVEKQKKQREKRKLLGETVTFKKMKKEKDKTVEKQKKQREKRKL